METRHRKNRGRAFQAEGQAGAKATGWKGCGVFKEPGWQEGG